MHYLICERCNGYYELQEGESEEDFLKCNCGGTLKYLEYQEPYNDLEYSSDENEYIKYSKGPKNEYEVRGSITIKKLIFFVSVFVLISVLAASSFTKFMPVSANNTGNNSTIIGSNVHGYVDKYVYSSASSGNKENRKIAIITGIHPREPISKTVWGDILKKYDVPSGWTIVQYDINVVDNPKDFTIGRNNGETLAATYILNDIIKSKYEMVIVCHDHEPGYGDGFYFATPAMDTSSVKFAESLKQKLPNFNYYKSNNNSEHGSSNIHFTDPLVSHGYRAIVYEIPGLTNYTDAYNMNILLLDSSFNLL